MAEVGGGTLPGTCSAPVVHRSFVLGRDSIVPKASILKKTLCQMNLIVQAGEKIFPMFFFLSFFGPINEQMHSCVVFSSNQGEPYTCYHGICTVVVPAQQTFLWPEVEYGNLACKQKAMKSVVVWWDLSWFCLIEQNWLCWDVSDVTDVVEQASAHGWLGLVFMRVRSACTYVVVQKLRNAGQEVCVCVCAGKWHIW